MAKSRAIPSQRGHTTPFLTAINTRGHSAGFIRHIDLANMIMPNFAMGSTVSGNENLMQASVRSIKSGSFFTTKLIEMERDKLISIRILQITDKAAAAVTNSPAMTDINTARASPKS